MKRKFLPSALRPLAGPPGTAARGHRGGQAVYGPPAAALHKGLSPGPGKPPSSTPKKTPRHTPAMAQKNGSFFYKAVMTVVVTLLFSGLFGCGGTGKSEEVVSFYTSSYGMARKPEYAFSLYRRDDAWYFSASCHVNSPYSHDTSFGSFPLPAKDAAGFLAVLRKEGEIDRLRNYRTPLLTRLLASIFPISDGSTRYSGMTFADGSSLERNTRVSARVLDSLYDLETDGYDWFLSFGAVLDGTGGYTQGEKWRLEIHDEEEILRIIRQEQLVARVKQYKKSVNERETACAEATYQISFRFRSGLRMAVHYAPPSRPALNWSMRFIPWRKPIPLWDRRYLLERRSAMKHPIRFRISALLLALTMALSLCACGVNPQTLRDALAQTQAGSSRNESPEPSPPETSGEKTPDTEAASTSRPAASPGPGPGSEEARQSLQLLRDRLDCSGILFGVAYLGYVGGLFEEGFQ